MSVDTEAVSSSSTGSDSANVPKHATCSWKDMPWFSYDKQTVKKVATRFGFADWSCTCGTQMGKDSCPWHEWGADVCFHCGEIEHKHSEFFHSTTPTCAALVALCAGTCRTATWIALVRLGYLASPKWLATWEKQTAPCDR